jgi:hypothetical protein
MDPAVHFCMGNSLGGSPHPPRKRHHDPGTRRPLGKHLVLRAVAADLIAKSFQFPHIDRDPPEPRGVSRRNEDEAGCDFGQRGGEGLRGHDRITGLDMTGLQSWTLISPISAEKAHPKLISTLTFLAISRGV